MIKLWLGSSLENGAEILVIDNFLTGHEKNLDDFKDKIKIFEADISEPETGKKNLQDAMLYFTLSCSSWLSCHLL